MNILKAQNSIITLEDGRGTGDCGRDIYLRWHSETEAQPQDLSAMFEDAGLFIFTLGSHYLAFFYSQNQLEKLEAVKVA